MKLQVKPIVTVFILLPVLIAASILPVLTGKSSRANAASLSNTTLKWSTQPAAGNGIWTSITWSPELGKFVAVARASAFPIASNKRIMTSTDGKNWTLVGNSNIPTLGGVFTSVTWSPEVGLFVAVTCSRTSLTSCVSGSVTNLRVMTSPDGDVWTERTTPDTNSAWQSIVWSPDLDLFVAVADGGDNSVMTSPDGINWTARTAPEDNAWKSVVWSPELDLFVAVAGSGTNRVMTSPDGINWTARTASEANTWISAAWSPELGRFAAVSSDGTNRVMSSTNGITWSSQTAAAANAWASVAWSPALQKFAAVANSGTNRIMTSADGVTWTAQAASVDNAWNAITWSPSLSTFVAVGSGGTFDTGTATSARVMTGSMTTVGTNVATNVAPESATLNGEYSDDFPASNIFFTGSNVFFRYREAGSGAPFTDTTPQTVAAEGAFSANVTGLDPDNTIYEYKAVVQWASASGTETLEGGLQTFATAYADDDNDGVSNVAEDAAPNNGDGNNDGTPDSAQSFVASLVNTVTNKYAVLQLDSSCAIEDDSIAAESANTANDPSYDYPAGLMDFTADCGTPGFAATITQYYYGLTNDNFVFRKYNPSTKTYSTVSGAAIQEVTIGGQAAIKVTYQVTDGGSLDADGAANGTIVDPAGLALAVSSSGNGLANTGQNTTLYSWLAVVLLSSSVGAVVWRKKYETKSLTRSF